jgi:hypothetical protein
MKTLKPCPFCGAAPEHEPWHGGGPDKTMVWCVSEDCVASPSVVGETQDLAADKWNQRAQSEPALITTE